MHLTAEEIRKSTEIRKAGGIFKMKTPDVKETTKNTNYKSTKNNKFDPAEYRKNKRLQELENTKKKRNAMFIFAIAVLALILIIIAIISRL